MIAIERPRWVGVHSLPTAMARIERFTETPAAEAALLMIRLGLFLLAVASPVAAAVSRRAIFILTPVGCALLLIGGLLAPRGDILGGLRRAALSPSGIAGLFLAFWAGLSLIWTPFLADAGERYVKTLATCLLVLAAAAAIPGRTRTSNLYLFPIGVALAAIAAILVNLFGPDSITGGAEGDSPTLDRATIGIVVLLWPSLGALMVRERWMSAGVLAAIAMVGVVAVWTPIALLAIVTGALTFAVATSRPRQTGRVLAFAFAALFLLAPLLPFVIRLILPSRNPDIQGFLTPILVWTQIVSHEGVRLITGHGLDMATRGEVAGYLPAETPRSILFETWYDLGIVGAVSAAVLLGRALIGAGRTGVAVAPFLLAGIVSGMTIAILGLSTAQVWWVSLLGITAIAFTTAVKGEQPKHRPASALTTAHDPRLPA